MKRVLGICAIAALLSVLAGSANAVPFAGDVTEWSSDTVMEPGLVFPIGGSGQVNGNFVGEQEADVQIALRANRRFSPEPLERLGNTYIVEAGESAPGLALWNYDVHIDFRYSDYSMSDYDIFFTTDIPNHSAMIPMQTLMEMNMGLNPGSLDNVTLLQTSVNPGFFGSGYDPFAPGLHTFDLLLVPTNPVSGAPLLATTMVVDVQPVPEPATLLVMTASLGGLGGYLRRRTKA